MIPARRSRFPRRAAGLSSGIAAALMLGVVASLATAAPASAHTALVASDPVAGASLSAAPEAVTLTFTETMSAELSTVTVSIDGRAPTELRLSLGESREQLVGDLPDPEPAAAPATEPSQWRVAYRVVSRDGHPVTGTIDFTVAESDGATPAPEPSAEPTASAQADVDSTDQASSDDATPWWPFALGAVVLIGLFGWLARGANRRRATR